MSLFVKKLKENGRLEQIQTTLFIVGSRKMLIEDDYGSGDWSILAPNLRIFGFDADEDACDAANADLELRQVNWTEKHFPLAISNNVGNSTIYVTQSPDCSSLYPPNEAYVSRLYGYKDSLKVDLTVEIETTNLDTFCREEGIEEVDFIQIDVQGAELDVLRGASQILENSLLGVQLEVEFSPLYANQPLFSDVDVYLRKYDFTLFDLATDHQWCRVTRASAPIYSSTRKGQLIWANACYLRDLIGEKSHIQKIAPKRIVKLACIADILGFPEYALELLEYLTIHHGDDAQYNFAHNIVETLSEIPELVEQGLNALPVINNIQHRF